VLYDSTLKSRGGDCRFFPLGDWVRLVRHSRPVPDAIIGAGLPASDFSICREVSVIKDDISMQSCIFSQPAFADWKEGSTAAINAR
jgi:hypothetical protein